MREQAVIEADFGRVGATIVLGPVQLKGMGLATVVAMVMSCVFLFFEKIHWANEE